MTIESVSYDPAEPVLTVNDLMVRWKCTRKVILAAIAESRLAAFKVGTRVFRVTVAEVMRYEQARRAA